VLERLASQFKIRVVFPGHIEAKLRPFSGGRMTVAGVLQLIDESLQAHVLVVRDYGIGVMPRDQLTNDMLTYCEFRRAYLPLLSK
jgi:hypothetical protein